jgi:hypothetical protein
VCGRFDILFVWEVAQPWLHVDIAVSVHDWYSGRLPGSVPAVTTNVKVK